MLSQSQDFPSNNDCTEELKASKARLSALLDAIPDLMIRMTRDGVYIDFQPTKDFNMLISSDEVIGKSIYEVLPKEVAEERMFYVEQTFSTGSPQVYELERWINGSLRDQEARIAASGEDEVLVLVRDITERKQAEKALRHVITQLQEEVAERKQVELTLRQSEAQLRQQAQQLELTIHELRHTQAQLIQTEKMSSLGQMVAGIAHEINNPVNFIYGNLQYMDGYVQDLLDLVKLYRQQHSQLTPVMKAKMAALDVDFLATDLPKMVSSMRIGAERIRCLILSLRNFSRLDESEVKAVDLHEGIDNTLLILNHRFVKQINVIKQYDNLPLIECYPAQLNQVFMNILTNAIDALLKQTEQFNKQIFIETQVLTPHQIGVRICDNGPGIRSDIKGKIFDPFFTTKPVGEGTGLGLTISYQIIEKHQGQITVNSQYGEGTEFFITLPVKQKPLSERIEAPIKG